MYQRPAIYESYYLNKPYREGIVSLVC
jgi:hypothetical protein